MGSIRTVENIAKLAKTSVTTLSLPASRLNIGAAQYVISSAIALNTATVGAGGVDATIVAGSLYYVYAVLSSNQVYLIASLSSSLPSGFTQAKAVGGFTTDASSQIDQVGEYAGNLAVAGSVSAGGGLTSQPTQNFLINGAMDFSQRYVDSSISNIGADKYTLDRWWVNSTNDANQYVQRVAITDLLGFRYAMKIARTASTGSMGRIQQPLEYANVLPLQGKTVTLSFWYKTTGTALTGLYALYSYDTTADLKEPLTGYYNFSNYTPTTTWQRYSATFAVPATAKSLAVSLMRTGSSGIGDLLITGAMLNIGTSAAPFQRAGGTIGGELNLCQRYFEKSFPIDAAPANGANATSFATSYSTCYAFPLVTWSGAGAPSCVAPFKVTKRAIPIATRYGNSSGQWAYLLNGSLPTSQTAWTFVNNLGVFPGSNSTYVTETFLTAENNTAQATLFNVIGHWTADAEL